MGAVRVQNLSVKAFPKRERVFVPMTEEELGRLMAKQAKKDMKRHESGGGFRQRHKAADYVPSEAHTVLRRLNLDSCRSVLEFIEKNPRSCRKEISGGVPETARQARARMDFLHRNGFIDREGGGRYTRYFRTDKPAEFLDEVESRG